MKNKTLKTVALVVGGVIIFILIMSKRNGTSLSQTLGDTINMALPSGAQFTMPEINIPGLTLPDFGGVILPDRKDPMSYPPANSCGCGVSNATELVAKPTPFVDNTSINILPPALKATYVPPPCIMKTDWNALTAPGTALGDWLTGPRGIKGKHYSELASAGYSQSPAGWAKYVVDYPRGIKGNQNRTQDRLNILSLAKDFQRCM